MAEGANVVDVTSAAYQRNPHALLAEAARQGPIARDPWGTPLFLRYADVDAALRDTRFINDYDVLLTRHGVDSGPLYNWWKLAMLNTNPPVHTRLRGLAARAFTVRAVDGWRRQMRALTRAHFDSLDGAATIEFIEDVAEPLPLTIVGEVIGLPRSDHGQFRHWVADLGLMFTDSLAAADRIRAESAMLALHSYVVDLIERIRSRPDATLLASLIAAEDHGDRLSHDELVALVINLLLGALDTSRSALSSGLLWASRLGARGAIAPAFVDEVLRFEPPTGELRRTAQTDLVWRDVEICAGESVALSVMAANRDRDVYAAPDMFDIDRFSPQRAPRPHLSFGRGAHLCLGHALARAEIEEVLSVMFDDFPQLEVATTDPRWLPFLRVRRFECLEVRLGPRARRGTD